MATCNPVPSLYRTVVEDVVNNVRESFLDEGVDEQVLLELKQLWKNRLLQSKTVEGIHLEQKDIKPQTQQQLHMTQTAQQPAQATKPQPQQPQPVQAAAAQPTAVTATPQATQFQYNHVYNPVTGTVNLSNAVQTATAVLPAGLNQQQITATVQQGATLGTGTITLQTGQGPAQFIVQAPQQMIAQQQPGQPQVVQTGTSQLYTVAGGVPVSQIVQNTPNGSQRQVAGHPGIIQLDGTQNSSSDEDDDDDDKDDEDDDEKDEEGDEEQVEEEEPLNSEDDVSDEDPLELFDTDNVVVCQYDKINRAKNKWKFHLKDGIMNLNGQDFVFHKASGDAEW